MKGNIFKLLILVLLFAGCATTGMKCSYKEFPWMECIICEGSQNVIWCVNKDSTIEDYLRVFPRKDI